MAQGSDSKEKIVYVGDSRIRKNRKQMLPRDYSAYPGKSETFLPNFLLKEWMVGVVALVGFLALVISEPAPLGYPADPTDGSFIPIPDWYFLFMYQILKYPYLSQDYVVLGTLGIPGIMFGSLLLAPFLDRGKERRFYRRPIASTLMILSIIAVVYLTKFSWDHYQNELAKNGVVPEHIIRMEEWRAEVAERQASGGGAPAKPLGVVAEDHPGAEIYKSASCINCHGTDLKGQAGNPRLIGVGEKLDQDRILHIIENGMGNMPAMGDALRGEGLSDDDIATMAEWLAMQKAETVAEEEPEAEE